MTKKRMKSLFAVCDRMIDEAGSYTVLETVLNKYFEDRTMADCGVATIVTSYDKHNCHSVLTELA